ncbi:MAG: RNA 2',3'-cyclic phosphodiesterase [Clostridia bacterium]|nr:RNA 2',3'-cyclic phosphodiesterase [Clostridia bacterium]
MKLRLFWAIKLDQKLQTTLPWLELKNLPLVAKWVKPEQLHMTLVFLGEVEQKQVPDLIAQVRQKTEGFAPFELQINRLGFFPNAQQPRVFWAGLAGAVKNLRALQAQVLQGVEAVGLPVEKRSFSPHLTLARIKSLSGKIESLPSLNLRWPVASLQLFSSQLTPQGSIYHLEAEIRGRQ